MWYWRWPSFSKAIQWSGPSEIGAAIKWDSGFFGRCALRKTLRFCPWCSRILPLSRDCSSRFAGIMAADLGGYDSADGIASILIGLLLAVVAGFLAREIKSLLVGKAASPTLRKGICEILASETGPGKPIRKINDVLRCIWDRVRCSPPPASTFRMA